MYKDKAQLNLIDEVHAMTYDEEEATIADKLPNIGIHNIGASYWLASAGYNSYLWYVLEYGGKVDWYNYCNGVRPVVSLKSGVYIASGEGTDENPYVLGKD